ncbi:MAG: D-cysteine desulfhydrase family protein, partial [Candidatus Acetothermia bacterium]
MQVGDINHLNLGEFPTPLQKLQNLSDHLEGPQIYIKRDDLNGLGAGGNKLRKLEYALADARKKGATTIITTGAIQTNHGRLTLASANKLGLKTVLILTGQKPDEFTGNILLDRIMGAEEIHYLDPAAVEDQDQALEQKVDAITQDLIEKGEEPYYVPIGCDPLHGTLGYSNAVLEIVNQLNERGTSADYIVAAAGTASTQSGLVLGSRLYAQDEIEVIGISVSYHVEKRTAEVAEQANETAEFLELDTAFHPEEMTVLDHYIGEDYAVPTPEMKEAVQLVARKEGLILDPVYTGKAMAELIDFIR